MNYLVDNGEITRVTATSAYDAADLARLATPNKKPAGAISVLECLPVERIGRREEKNCAERILLRKAVFETAESEPESAA